ncbi:MAG: formate dehydrogenase accessory sulfurtransferase FdhD [Planctomycetota bacterium]
MTRDVKKKYRITTYRDGEREETPAAVAVEAPVRIKLNGERFMTLQCTPNNLAELAYGYFVTEAVVKNSGDIKDISVDEKKDVVDVTAQVDEERLAKLADGASFTTGCGRGITFSAGIDITDCDFKMNMMVSISPATALEYQRKFSKESELYLETRGVHSAALYRGEDSMAFADDVGRHNAVDKVIGMALRAGAVINDAVLMCSGRPSFDIVLKCLRAGVPIIITRGAPTTLAIDVAESGHLSLLQVRGQALKIYSGAFRVK